MLTVFTPIYNCRNYLDRSYECLKNQTYSNWEWVVVDDGSIDGSIAFFEKLTKEDLRVKYFRFEFNKGRGAARAKALSSGTTNVAFVVWDIDDLYTITRLEEITNAFSNPSVDFFASSAIILTNNLDIKGARNIQDISEKDLTSLYVHPSMAFSKKIADLALYDESSRAGEDLELMLYLKYNVKGFFSSKYLTCYVEDREVNLAKARLANINQFKSVLKLQKLGKVKVSNVWILKRTIKIIILYACSIWPSLYLKSVNFRQMSYIKTQELEKDMISFLKRYIVRG